jgi:zinc protease
MASAKFGGRQLLFATLLATVSPLAGPALASTPSWPTAQGLTADPAFRTGILPNGMRYAIRRNATPPGEAALRLRIDAGSLHEEEDQRGLAHFLEHMVLNGTKNVPEGEFVRRLERFGLKFGPDTNASTSFDETVFMLDLPSSNKETVDTALFLLREVADKATLDAAAIDRERGIILSEERSRATPTFRALVSQFNFLFEGQRLPTRFPIGSTEVIRTAPRERLLAFYNAYYRPENATLVAVGDFDVAEMEAKIRTQFADWQGEGKAGPRASEGRPRQRSAEADLLVDPGLPAQILMTWVRPADLSADSRTKRQRDYVEAVGLAILNRRLERIAATRSPSPFIGAQAGETQLSDTADLTQVFAVGRPGEWKPALETLEQEQRRLLTHGPTATEIEREVTTFRAALTTAAAGANTRTNAALATAVIAALADDQLVLAPDAELALFDEAVTGLTPASVTTALRPLFSGSGPLVSKMSPVAVEGGEQALLAALNQSTRVAVAAPAEEKVAAWPHTSFGTLGTVASRQEFADVGATVVTFANNVRLVVRPSQLRKDEILVRAFVGDGKLDMPTSGANPEWMLSLAMPLNGSRRMSAEDMQQALAGKTVSANFLVGDDAFFFQGQTRPADFATQMQLLAANVAEPGWRPSGWERVRALGGTIQDQLASTPAGVFNRDVPALLRRGDPRWSVPGREAMAAMGVKEARAALEGPLARDPIEVVVVGDITVDEAIRQTAATFGALPARTAARATPGTLRFAEPPKEPVVLRHKGRADQALAMIAWPTQGFHADPKTARTLQLLAEVYQLRLTNKIREEQGTTYSPQAGSEASDAFDRFGFLSGRVEASPGALPRFLTDAQQIADELARTPVTADELERARRPLLERIERDRAGNGWWLSRLDGLGSDPRTLATLNSQLPQLRAVTPADIQAAARRFMVARIAYRVTILPESKAAQGN